MKKVKHIFILFLLTISKLSHGQSSGTLVIEASMFHDDRGKAIVHLFRQKDSIPKKPFMESESVIIGGKTRIVFKNIPFGEYAAILFHDENSNDRLDHRFGFPNEPMGLSNSWKLSLFSGMPTFEKLKFSFDVSEPSYSIKIN